MGIVIIIVENKEPNKLTTKKCFPHFANLHFKNTRGAKKCNKNYRLKLGQQRTQIYRFIIMSRVVRLNKKKTSRLTFNANMNRKFRLIN